MIEIRIHGRGGGGAVTSAKLLALAAISEGKYAVAFPSFGPERRGAPVLAFVKVDKQPIRVRSEIQEPDVVLVLDPSLLCVVDVTAGLKKTGIIIVNSRKEPSEMKADFAGPWKFATVNALAIARDVIGVPIVNTTMMGALAKCTGVVGLESLGEAIREVFGARAAKNITACHRAFEETVVI
ncbi:MAG: pyruvate/ketoisovalerate oxidoreductase, gamma subunit [Dehalococcoidia bacterium]|nr:pyruvate/ketoisovalerate oxidoreductase, gamma subunit [Dehalococcoidia bacterium]